MSSGHWRYIIALGCLTLGTSEAFAQSPQSAPVTVTGPAVEEGATDQTNDQEKTAENPPFRVTIVADPEEANRPDTSASNAEQREKRDVEAQERMADAADALVALTDRQVIIGVVGTILLIVTVWASVSAYHLTLNTSRVQFRAYLSASVSRFHVSNVVSGGPTVFHGELRLENVGQTIAEKISAEAAVRLHNETGELLPTTVIAIVPSYFEQIAPNSSRSLKMQSEAIAGLETHGNIMTTLRVTLRYRDAFKRRHSEVIWFQGKAEGSDPPMHQIPDPSET